MSAARLSRPADVAALPGAIVARSAAVLTAPAVLAKYRDELTLNYGETMSRHVGPWTKLIPKGELPQVIAAIEAGLQPAPLEDIDKAIAVFGAAFWRDFQKADPRVLEMFTLGLREDLSPYPADIGMGAVQRVRRTFRFGAPDSADLCAVADELMGKRRLALLIAQAHLREHQRREEEAKQREWEEQARQAYSAEWHARLCAVYDAELVPPPAELDDAESGMLHAVGISEGRAWMAALEAGEAWVLIALWQCGLAMNVVRVVRDYGRLTERDGADIVARIQAGYSAAAAHLDKLGLRAVEIGRTSRGYPFELVMCAMDEMVATARRRWPPKKRDEWRLVLDHLAEQRLDKEAQKAWLDSWFGGDSEKVDLVARLVAAEAERAERAAADPKAAMRAAFVEAGLPVRSVAPPTAEGAPRDAA